ncbi:hypothetical protein OBBRIDRAFT_232289 [Obba rivulosa]|uniref:RED-like N-terminal domain-containing protein n=1 Tax=Obba rivulosa TaxID=1052685 RepID=A0A8E2DVA7_9APHY|nr:hypothetical protein OBBRIDRAFT_232289 [Obba rivulosa]
MDQDSFRKLLQTPHVTSGAPARGSLLAAATSKSKAKTVDAGQPAFKPRTVKKKTSDAGAYRDRAAERRLGINSDYAQVEALAEDFERKAAENADRKAVEEQRQYLGGDSTHTVLVKGLDLSLLEQSRARLAASSAVEEDESLERAFREAAAAEPADTHAHAPRKRTREEILAAIKRKRARTDEGGGDADAAPAEQPALKNADAALEEAKKAGKFRPIGFKPIGGEKKVKKGKPKEKGEKKRKAAATPSEQTLPAPAPEAEADTAVPEAGPSKPPEVKPLEPEPAPPDEDFDIFADAGEYTGVELGDDDEDSESDQGQRGEKEEREQGEIPPAAQAVRARWIDVEEDERASSAKAGSVPPTRTPEPTKSLSPRPVEGEEEEQPMRLQPLASSAIPSIRDLLEADKAADKSQKWRERKEKKKQDKGKVDKEKVDRDYKRLKAFTDKKAGKEP